MNLANNIILNIYSIAILIIVYFLYSKHEDKESIQFMLYKSIVYTTIAMLIFDILSRFDGKPNTIFPIINYYGNFFIYLLNPIVPSLWLLYVHYQIYRNEEKMKRLIYPLSIINFINVVCLVLTQFYGWYYYIDKFNIYHRGPYFLIPTATTVMVLIASYILILKNYKKITDKNIQLLFYITIPPFICIFLQTIFYGVSIILNSLVISLIIISLVFQNRNMYTDYLTGVNNRNKLEVYLKKKIKASKSKKTFSAIMLDLNNFKTINDTFGHDMGDAALQESANLLKSCIRSNDFISRFGGDEFYIVLDISDKKDLEEIISRINKCINIYNETSGQPYKLSFSMGYAIYDARSNMNKEEFQRHIDLLMYKDKKDNKELEVNFS